MSSTPHPLLLLITFLSFSRTFRSLSFTFHTKEERIKLDCTLNQLHDIFSSLEIDLESNFAVGSKIDKRMSKDSKETEMTGNGNATPGELVLLGDPPMASTTASPLSTLPEDGDYMGRFKQSWGTGLRHLRTETVKEVSSLQKELYEECVPKHAFNLFGDSADLGEGEEEYEGVNMNDENDNTGRGQDSQQKKRRELGLGETCGALGGLGVSGVKKFASWLYLPHFPAFHRPGWLVRHIVGPYDQKWIEALQADIGAGVTVAMTLIPQGLSYATLANQPPINGLYSAVLPCAVYAFFGCSMYLAVGPVAIVALLVGSLVSKYGIDVGSVEAVDFAGQVSLCCGIILILMSLLNLGNFIRFISHPVMSGFTTAAAMLIGMNQLKGAFGFKTASGYYPQVGDGIIHYNYEVMKWVLEHFNDTYSAADGSGYTAVVGKSIRNPYSMMICFGLYIPLIINQTMKKRFKPTRERKAWWVYRLWINISNLGALLAIIVGACVAMSVKTDNSTALLGSGNDSESSQQWYAANLKVVGAVPAGLDIIRVPDMKYDVWTLLPDVLPLTLIAFMESYSIAKKMATMKNELHILSPSQELWAVGLANVLGAVSSSFPVAGSYSRSSINYSAGGRTPLSKITTLLIVILALQVLTDSFGYIPYSCLCAIIWCGVTNLIDVRDFWNCWKYSKKDFFTMVVTFLVTLIFETSIGLAVGLFVSILIYLAEVSFGIVTAPHVVSDSKTNGGVDVIRLEGDLTFLTAHRK